MKPRPTALIIDGERAIRRLLRIALDRERYKVLDAENGQSGLRACVEERPDVIILDLNLPDMDGLAVVQSLREWSLIPVLILSERDSATDKVSAFDCGADDYMTKPFDTSELLARLRVLQRTIRGIPDGPLLVEGDLKINLSTHETTFKGEKLELTPTEEALLYLLVRHVGKVVTNGHLAHSIWGSEEDANIHGLRVYVAQLRKKLGGKGGGSLIRSEANVGYCLSPRPSRENTNLSPISQGH
jgi:two-component system KDP operon response regulator KdpE